MFGWKLQKYGSLNIVRLNIASTTVYFLIRAFGVLLEMINAEVFIIFHDQDELLFSLKNAFRLYEISFEIDGDPYNMIGFQQRDFSHESHYFLL